jgi:hypothetical protein
MRKKFISIISLLSIAMFVFAGCGRGIRKNNYTKRDIKNNTLQKNKDVPESVKIKELSDEELLASTKEEEVIKLEALEDELIELEELEELLIENDPLSDIPIIFQVE